MPGPFGRFPVSQSGWQGVQRQQKPDKGGLRVDAGLGIDPRQVGSCGVQADAERFGHVTEAAAAGHFERHALLGAGKAEDLGGGGDLFLHEVVVTETDIDGAAADVNRAVEDAACLAFAEKARETEIVTVSQCEFGLPHVAQFCSAGEGFLKRLVELCLLYTSDAADE